MIERVLRKLFKDTIESIESKSYDKGVTDTRGWERKNKAAAFRSVYEVGRVFICVTPTQFDVVELTGFACPSTPESSMIYTKSLLTGDESVGGGILVPYSHSILEALAKLEHHERYQLLTKRPTRKRDIVHIDPSLNELDIESIKEKVRSYNK